MTEKSRPDALNNGDTKQSKKMLLSKEKNCTLTSNLWLVGLMSCMHGSFACHTQFRYLSYQELILFLNRMNGQGSRNCSTVMFLMILNLKKFGQWEITQFR